MDQITGIFATILPMNGSLSLVRNLSDDDNDSAQDITTYFLDGTVRCRTIRNQKLTEDEELELEKLEEREMEKK